MSDTWVSLAAFVNDKVVTNTKIWEILNNLQYLKNRPEADTLTFAGSTSSEGEVTNTGTEQDNLPTDKWEIELETRGGDVIVGSTIYATHSGTSGDVLFSLAVDGVGLNNKETYEHVARISTVWREARGVFFLVKGLTPGLHVFNLRYGTTPSTLTLNIARRTHMWAIEVGE